MAVEDDECEEKTEEEEGKGKTLWRYLEEKERERAEEYERCWPISSAKVSSGRSSNDDLPFIQVRFLDIKENSD